MNLIGLAKNEDPLIKPAYKLYLLFHFISRSPLVQMSECEHPAIIQELCALCGLDFRKSEIEENAGSRASIIHTAPHIRVNLKVGYLI